MILLAHGFELHNPIVIYAALAAVSFVWRFRFLLRRDNREQGTRTPPA